MKMIVGPIVTFICATARSVSSFHITRPTSDGARRSFRVASGGMSMRNYDIVVDVGVVGGGIGGTTISYLLQEQQQCKVALIDPMVNKEASWYPNYGEWREEWHKLSERLKLPELRDATTTEWDITDTFFGGSFDIPEDERMTLNRPYVRVDRVKLQKLLRGRFEAAEGVKVAAKVNAQLINTNVFDKNIVHDKDGTTITLDDGRTIRCKVVIDATGLESKLVGRESPVYARGSTESIPAGYQIAYGFLVDTDSLGPYDEKAMTLFDYRTSHFDDDPEWLKDAVNRPTFMYTMPLGRNRDGTYKVFFEETSLVGRGARRLSFAECKKRAYKRLAYHGIKVLAVDEEEYCYIPMGGELPDLTQRIVGFAGAANMVHPSTGYHACRMMAAATDVAGVIGNGIREDKTPDAIAAAAYTAMWSENNRRQRDFQVYGGDFLMRQNVNNLRGFFKAFFRLEEPVWAGFLAGWPGLPNNEYHESWEKRLQFAFGQFLNMPNPVRLSITLYAVAFTLKYGPNVLFRSILPPFLLSAPPDPKIVDGADGGGAAVEVGDEEAKEEARRMIKEFQPSLRSSSDKRANAAAMVSVGARAGGDVKDITVNSSGSNADVEFSLPAPFN